MRAKSPQAFAFVFLQTLAQIAFRKSATSRGNVRRLVWWVRCTRVFWLGQLEGRGRTPAWGLGPSNLIAHAHFRLVSLFCSLPGFLAGQGSLDAAAADDEIRDVAAKHKREESRDGPERTANCR